MPKSYYACNFIAKIPAFFVRGFCLFLGFDDFQGVIQADFFAFIFFGDGIVVFAPFDIRAVTAVVQSDIGFVFGMLAENCADRAFRRAGQNGFGSFQRDVENSVCAG